MAPTSDESDESERIECDHIPATPLFEDLFNSMLIPGDYGLAVARETLDERYCIAIGQSDRVYRLNVFSSEPSNPLEVVKSALITQIEFERLTKLLDGEFHRNGIVGADMLDGVSYMVKWIQADVATRLILSNPQELDDPTIKLFASQLDRFLSFQVVAE